MSKLISVSTKKGDKGESYLIGGKKIPKSDIVFEVLGTLDELNSHLGLVVVKIKRNPSHELAKNANFLQEIQNTLFYLGAQLAGSTKEKLKKPQLSKLEREADKLQIKMADNWIVKFVLPGGTELGAHIDISRTVSRRLERLIVALSEKKPVPELILKYVNRLSDYLFILRCFANDRLSVEENLFDSSKSF
ncbi:cob(I)yrinic acid a,c-diamide adenosyltransferase [Patescibacteria group bacterium]|nr:cob(I)yrinic acid a,c-diamide adenosyltransferase [Patescibacteria group bacterium]